MEWSVSLAEQLEWHWRHHARPRLDGLTDVEYLWEPADGCWSVRRRDDAAPSSANFRAGGGEYVCDYGFPEPAPAPVTTIAWRLAHLVVGVFAARNHSYFGGAPASYDTWEFSGTADGALAQLDAEVDRWLAGVRALDDAGLAELVGDREPAEFAHLTVADLVLHIHREAIHHLAEVALLRDLHAHRPLRG